MPVRHMLQTWKALEYLVIFWFGRAFEGVWRLEAPDLSQELSGNPCNWFAIVLVGVASKYKPCLGSYLRPQLYGYLVIDSCQRKHIRQVFLLEVHLPFPIRWMLGSRLNMQCKSLKVEVIDPVSDFAGDGEEMRHSISREVFFEVHLAGSQGKNRFMWRLLCR